MTIPADATSRDLVPGDPQALHDLAATLRRYAGAFDDARQSLQTVQAADWTGVAAIDFRRAVRVLPENLAEAHDQFSAAAGALAGYADALRAAQDAVPAILDDAAQARQASQRHQADVDDYNAAVEREDAVLPPRPGDVDPRVAAMAACETRLAALRADVEAAAQAAETALRDAAERAPDKPGLIRQALEQGQNFLQGAYEGLTGLSSLAGTLMRPWEDPGRTAMTLAQMRDGLAWGVHNPIEFGKAVLNWEMWQENPARALGQLAPDLIGGKGLTRLRSLVTPNRPPVRPDGPDADASARRPEDMETAGDPIDMATGQMLLPQTDVRLPGVLPLLVQRTHLSGYTAGGWFGPSWASTLDQRVQLDANGVVFVAPDGMRLVYPVPRPNTPTLPEKGPRWPLLWDGTPAGAMRITDPATGRTFSFADPVPTSVPGVVDLPLHTIEDRHGNRVELIVDDDGLPMELRHTGGYRIAVERHLQLPRITALRLLDTEGPGTDTTLIGYGYDEDGHLTEVVNSSGLPMRFSYDEHHRITSWTDRNGTSYRFVYDERGRVVRGTGSDGCLSAELSYDDERRLVTYTDSLGHPAVYEHNAAYRIVRRTDPLGHTTEVEWSPDNRDRVAVTDPLGRTTRYAHDAAGNLTAVHLPDGSVARATHNEFGLPTEITEPDGATWRHTYDERGNLTATVDPAGAETRYEYDARGNLVAVTDALGHTRRITTDAAGLPRTLTDPLGNTTVIERDAHGRITEVTDPLGNTTRHGWIVEGKPAWREAPDGTRETWVWDAEGNLVEHTDPAGNTTRHATTHFDLPASRTEPDGSTYEFAYDTELRLVGVTNPQGLTWSYTYDAAGRLVSETDFNGRTISYTHDAAGQLVSRTNGAGQTVTFTRDLLGRTVEQRAEDGTTTASATSTTTFGYDAAGRLVHAAGPDAEVRFDRDPLGRVLAETVDGRTTTFGYDPLGRRTERRTPSGVLSRWTYDAAGRPATLHTGGHTLALEHDAAGHETTRRLGEHVELTQTWDGNHRLTTQTLASVPHEGAVTAQSEAARRLLQHRSYAYREDGHLTEIRDLTSGTRRFDLDRAGRVTAVHAHGWTETYAYDAAGNLKHAGATALASYGAREYDGTLVRRAGRTTYEHDAQGRTVRATRRLLSGGTREWTYRWNAEDRLVEATNPDGERWHYTYDPLGRRTAKRRLADDGTAAEEIRFSWDGSRLAEQVDATGETTTWDYAPTTHRPLTQTVTAPPATGDAPGPAPDARLYAVITDLVGTPTELVTPDGRIAWQHRTTLWGAPLPAPPAEADCPLRFPGQYADQETGLHYNYQRYYDPETARYLSPDPLGLEPALNHHAYVSNPWLRIDPLGLANCGVFENQLPGQLSRELADAERLGVRPMSVGEDGFDDVINNGTIKWAVKLDGQLVIIPKIVDGVELKHPVLTGGGAVRAAGEADLAGSDGTYFGLELNNRSGHYRPSPESLSIGREAFEQAGVVFP
ncbi:putative T7SS-secreted protein [Allostreptomyces psammosilenae]|uniref:RHS repeat-associated protein n=1 Tax=Allostreptomyces psammosilenae TaxID=1892865 RepID=A0A852ZXY3_9ACTN|nr:DUF6531 domain-containing protein [Allostreptomyces psammosilenae]NYI07233.1 RHS repeat-associated protein [Allostreptomyces psammosilenae]